jgi:SAM-dependent methyltransferase
VRACLPALAWVLWMLAYVPANAATLDVPTPYIPSTPMNVDEMLRVGNVMPTDVVYDLGSGDGRIVIAAAKDYGARGVGIELDPELVKLSTGNARAAGVAERAQFRQGDVLTADIKEATVVTMYLLTSLVAKLENRLLNELKAGTRIIAHDYGFEKWKPDREVKISKTYYLYVVPARVAGQWRIDTPLAQGREFLLNLEQQHQQIRGGVTAGGGGGFLPAFEARLSGERITFVLADNDVSHRFEGEVRGDVIEGVVRSGYGPKLAERPWRAQRVQSR